MLYIRILGCLCAAGGIFAPHVDVTAATADGKYVFNIYGFAQADFIYDLSRVDPDWEDTLRPSKVPTGNNKGAFGGDGQALFSIKQSRLGVSGDLPTDSDFGDVKFKFEFDLFGVGPNAGQTTMRIRHVYAEWGMLLAGQTNSVFMDGEVFPNAIDYWGPAGMVFYRNVQLRLTPYRSEHSHFAIALERPINDIDPGKISELDPELGANLRNDEKLPDLTVHYYLSDDWGHFQLASILRRVGFDTKNTPDNQPKGGEVGWGVNASGDVAVFERDKLLTQVVYGQGIASYMNDGGVDLAPEGTFPDSVRAKAVPLLGVVAYYDHYWNDRWSSSFGYSFTQVDNTNLQDPNAFHKGEYASANLLYNPADNLLIGGELLWGKRTDHNGASGDDLRFQFSVKYSFGTKITI